MLHLVFQEIPLYSHVDRECKDFIRSYAFMVFYLEYASQHGNFYGSLLEEEMSRKITTRQMKNNTVHLFVLLRSIA